MADNKKFLDKEGLSYFYNKIKGSYVKKTDLATVATSGDYEDLTNRPTIPSAINNLKDGIAEGSIRSINAYDNEDSGLLGKNAQAFGEETYATGENAHAEGKWTMASGEGSHAEGFNSGARGEGSHAEGNSSVDGLYAHSEGSSYAKGIKSHAEGGTTAEGDYSHSEGFGSEARGIYSHAEGWGPLAIGEAAHGEGENSIATAKASHAEGHNTIAGSKGYQIVSGDSSLKTYYLNDVSDLSVGLECFITSETKEITDLGQITAVSTTDNSITTSSFGQGEYICIKDRPDLGDSYALFCHPSHAEGSSSVAIGPGAHAEGFGSWAVKEGAHAEGYTYAGGEYSHSEGSDCQALGNLSHTEGWGTVAATDFQHAQGKFNLKDTTGDYAHIVGNGISDSDRSNIHTLDWQGNAWFSGDVYVGSTEGFNKDSGSKKLATVDDLKKAGDTLPIGAMIPWGGQTIPDNWLLCDGSAVSRTTYADLFKVLGTTYGTGNGSTTFNLPDLKGKTIVGLNSSDSSFSILGKTGGEKTHTLTIDEMASHNHKYEDITGNSSLNGQFSRDGSYSGSGYMGVTDSIQAYATADFRMTSVGGDQAHNNLQPYIVQKYIIKAFQSSGVSAQILNTKTTSTTNAYSCDYINNNFNSNVYSTSETVIGTWIDGRPIYRKVLKFTGLSTATVKTVSYNISNAVNQIWIEKGFVESSTGRIVTLPEVGYNGDLTSKTDIWIEKSESSVKLYSNGGWNSDWTFYITLNYTKTKD